MARGAKLGQHFLREPRIARRILEAAEVQPGHRVLEVGPGPGVLTEPLAKAVGPDGELVALELDTELADALEGRWDNVTLVRADAVQTDLAAMGRFDRLVSNLPYQISGPITAAFLDLLADPATRWDRAVLMYQREFADRLRAGPGSKAYGRLSVHAARWCRVSLLRDVPPGCFDPPPKVHSSVLVLDPHPEAPFEVADEAVWRAVVDGPFQQRRKQLRNTVPPAVAGLGVAKEDALAALEEEGLSSARPEAVPPARFAALANVLAASRGA
ncbi:MAG: 16S rRNA (adenine(1518)-N(6)/adenine(1519)-N(6))-dimethyltransferase RsmA [Thermoplasmatota archaeon]